MQGLPPHVPAGEAWQSHYFLSCFLHQQQVGPMLFDQGSDVVHTCAYEAQQIPANKPQCYAFLLRIPNGLGGLTGLNQQTGASLVSA